MIDMMKRMIVAFALMLSFVLIFTSCSNDVTTLSDGDAELESPETVSDPQVPGVNTDEPETNAEQAEDNADKPAVNDGESEKEDKTEVKEEPSIKLDIKPLEKSDEEILIESAEKLGFKNVNFFEAFANAIGVEPATVTQEDVDKVHYIAVSGENDGTNSILVGYIDYVDICFSDVDDSELMSKLNEVVMASAFEYDIETDSLSDLAKFKNVEIFEIYDVKIEDVSFIKEYENLAMGYFANNGITDVSCLEGYNPASLVEIDFTGNDIKDWTALYPIQDKVIVMYDMQSGFLLKLDSYLEQTKNNPSTENEENTEEKTEAVVKDETDAAADSKDKNVLYDENGNPVDFSSLFD